MGGDTGTRRLLALILACLVFLVVRDLLRGSAGRFVVTPLRAGAPVLIRTDTATGSTSMLELRAGGAWVPISEADRSRLEAAPADTDRASDASESTGPQPRALASDEIKALANAILGEDLTPDVRMWAVGQLAVTEDRRATLALIQLLEVVDDPSLSALIREALASRDDPRARQALARHAASQARQP
jgi:hypothetical protein